jgi:hypothetical protein
MKKRTLQVTLRADEASVIELTVGDRIQLDRIESSPNGTIAKQHGDLIGPGTANIALEPGNYLFRTLTDANLRVVTGSVTTVRTNKDAKNPLPPPTNQSSNSSGDTDPSAIDPPDVRGDEGTGELPALTVE